MEFALKINMDNAAFEDRPAGELAKCLNAVTERICLSGGDLTEGKIKDSNGNTVGSWQIN